MKKEIGGLDVRDNLVKNDSVDQAGAETTESPAAREAGFANSYKEFTLFKTLAGRG